MTWCPEGKIDVHGAYGKYCYTGYRHSLCHGWSCGVVPFLAEWVLGIRVTQPGCKTVEVSPHLGDLAFAEGTFPTPMGEIWVRHDRQPDGSVKTQVKAPEGVQVLQKAE